MKSSFAEILDKVAGEGARKMFQKVPEWKDVNGLTFPTSLSTEQCSSSATALYKSRLISSLFPSRRPLIADLTGGLGVDSWAFSAVAEHVLYNEMNEDLAECVQRNYSRLGITNVSFSSAETSASTIDGILGDFKPDLIFMDPARRSESGRKVFMLEDCSPDILTLRSKVLEIAPYFLVKLSPMADISLLVQQLGKSVSDVHVIEADGECKELLVLMDRNIHETYHIHVSEASKDESIVFTTEDERSSSVVLSPVDEHSTSLLLFEPGKALLKSGAFNLLCSRFGLEKLGRSTHLYTTSERKPELDPLGKWFSINEVRALNNRTMKEVGKDYPRSEVTARNIPMTSELLRKKMGTASGGSVHIFGIHSDLAAANLLLVATRL